ncbi:O-antigen ligase family protein [Polynucleobacter necessarius]|uniref:O-antigen ligase family protein n=1 Tax=Polynucleobacter necessarius TaxID=576610 RepID=UPI000E08D211|nr:O-antigen ligase family protein [Polynucleobacter necessarius]
MNLAHSQSQGYQRDGLGLVLLLLSSVLLGIWAVKNTIALRNIFLVIGAIIGTLYSVRQYREPSLKNALALRSTVPLVMLGLMFLWVIFHYLFLSRYPQEQLQELTSTWFRSLLAVLTAIGTAFAINKNKNLINWLWVGILASFFYLLCQYVPKAIAEHSLLAIDWYGYIFYGKINGVLAGSLMISGLTGSLLFYLVGSDRRRLIYASLLWVGGLLLAMYCYVFVFDARNGIGLTVLILMAASVWFFIKLLSGRHSFKSPISVKGLLVIALAVISLVVWFGKAQSDRNPGWRTTIEDVKVAIQIDRYPNWRDPELLGYPKTIDGRQVVLNNYERTAWATAGLTLFAPENPLGIGVMSRSFPRLLKQKFGKDVDYIPSTHSAWVDFTLSYGFPGLVLLLMPLIMIVWGSLISEVQDKLSGFRFVMGSALICMYTVGEISVQHGVEILMYWIAFLAVLHLLAKPSHGHLSPLVANN